MMRVIYGFTCVLFAFFVCTFAVTYATKSGGGKCPTSGLLTSTVYAKLSCDKLDICDVSGVAGIEWNDGTNTNNINCTYYIKAKFNKLIGKLSGTNNGCKTILALYGSDKLLEASSRHHSNKQLCPIKQKVADSVLIIYCNPKEFIKCKGQTAIYFWPYLSIYAANTKVKLQTYLYSCVGECPSSTETTYAPTVAPTVTPTVTVAPTVANTSPVEIFW